MEEKNSSEDEINTKHKQSASSKNGGEEFKRR